MGPTNVNLKIVECSMVQHANLVVHIPELICKKLNCQNHILH